MATEQARALRDIFKLDADEGYAIQLVIWPNSEDTDHWDADHMIQTEDLKDENLERTLRGLNEFLADYKKKPLVGKIEKTSKKRDKRKKKKNDKSVRKKEAC